MARARPIRDADGQVNRWFGSVADIDALRRATEAARLNEARYHALTDAVVQLVWVNDVTGLTEIPEGVASGWHIHPGEEVGYIIAGTVQMEIRDRPTLVLHAGDPFLIPPRVPHNALDLGPGVGMMLSTYIVEPGEPLATFVP